MRLNQTVLVTQKTQNDEVLFETRVDARSNSVLKVHKNFSAMKVNVAALDGCDLKVLH